MEENNTLRLRDSKKKLRVTMPHGKVIRKAAFNFGTMKSRNRGITSLKQALFALKIVEKAKELGFEG